MSLVAKAYALFREKGFLAYLKASIKYLRLSCYRRWGRYVFSAGSIRTVLHVIDEDDAVELLYIRTTERCLIKEILNELKPGDIFWDIGANLGFYALLAAGVPGVSAVAFEPNPATVKKLKNNIALNHRDNIKVLELALSDTESTVRFATMENRGHGKAHIALNSDGNTIEVKTDRGDKLVQTGAIPAPSVAKIDVEGAEGLVLKGMQNILAGCRTIFCEVHLQIQEYGGSAAELENVLKSAGFNLKKIQERGHNTYHLKASKM